MVSLRWWGVQARRHAPSDRCAERVERALEDLRRRGRVTLRHRLRQVQANLIVAVQAGAAGALAWVVAHEGLGNDRPVFAPVAAVGTIVSSVGQRLRRTVELIVGVAVGIGIGDLLIAVAGTGPWQVGVVVAVAVTLAIALSGQGALVAQAASTAVLIATLSPTVQDLEVPRVIDALVGGLTGLLVVILLLPLNPLRTVRRAAAPPLETLSTQLATTATALRSRQTAPAWQAQHDLQSIATDLGHLDEALSGAREVVNLSPVRRSRRHAILLYEHGIEQMTRATHSSRDLIRRAITTINDNEPIPAALPAAIDTLAAAVRHLRDEFGFLRPPDDTRRTALRAVALSTEAVDAGIGFSGTIIVGEIRSITTYILRATGLRLTEANHLIRRLGTDQHGILPPAE
ncbi:FUSC family protein [Micromonospora endolithica]|uniref:FUSC family protein n=1 Tax=Micromonospora endolithica TaxID=230091 RepID=A0A3A9YN50_9ACTN|nr:FUSC family protein [Micromonospora endolithica]RKN37671.1 FUSC family protein [Micromonospora endolithica]TWJ25164.1 fusaric acid resistance family protein [Micromonospora endolithica]